MTKACYIMTRAEQEKLLVADIKWIMQIPNPDVSIYHWVEKFVLPAVKITVYAGGHNFVLEDIPGNTSSLDVAVDNKKPFWVTGRENATELLNIRQQLLDKYDTKTK